MKTLKAVVVDDEPVMARLLERLLARHADICVAGTAHDGDEALQLIAVEKPDIVFLDIQMPGKNGMEVAAVLDRDTDGPMVVFVTAHDEFAMRAFAVNALDYVLKPFDEEDVDRVLRKLRKNRLRAVRELAGEPPAPKPATAASRWPRKVGIPVEDKMVIVPVQEIQYICAEDRMVFVHMQDGECYPVKQTLQEWERKLNPDQFLRCHRNFIVNMEQVMQVSPWFNRGCLLTLHGDGRVEIPVSRVNVKRLEEYMDL
ncbi:MAG TPA: LytTR family DNA-binding domain-containing protein [Patescibacteria group bacterium]|nr:LytTR family DNA-binding domain-containing protein [Patescibacteria group bacterium]